MLVESLVNVSLSSALALALVVGLVALVVCMRAREKPYSSLLCYKTSTILGSILGHLEWYYVLNVKPPLPLFLLEVANGFAYVLHLIDKDMIYTRLGPFRKIVFIVSARAARELLFHQRNIDKADEYYLITPWLGDGLLTSSNPRWRKSRKLLTPTFHFDILKQFIPAINESMRTLTEIIDDEMSRNCKHGVAVFHDIRPIAANCTIDIICETAMGVKMNAQRSWLRARHSGVKIDTLESEYLDAIRGYFETAMQRLIMPWLQPAWIFKLHPLGRKAYHYVSILHRFSNNVIEQRRKQMLELFNRKHTTEEMIAEVTKNKRLALLDLLLVENFRHGQEFSLENIREEVDTFLFGGHDTTTTAFYFTLLLLGHDQKRQAKIVDELETIFDGDAMRDVTADDLRHMIYLEQCIKESMRLYPPAAFFGRRITESFQVGSQTIPVGCTAIVLSRAIHTDPTIFEDPERFIPERFDDNSAVLQHPYAFIPFSAGPRNCVGQKFAMIELKILLATLLRRYRLVSKTPRELIPVDVSIISKALAPVSIQFEIRNAKTV